MCKKSESGSWNVSTDPSWVKANPGLSVVKLGLVSIKAGTHSGVLSQYPGSSELGTKLWIFCLEKILPPRICHQALLFALALLT